MVSYVDSFMGTKEVITSFYSMSNYASSIQTTILISGGLFLAALLFAGFHKRLWIQAIIVGFLFTFLDSFVHLSLTELAVPMPLYAIVKVATVIPILIILLHFIPSRIAVAMITVLLFEIRYYFLYNDRLAFGLPFSIVNGILHFTILYYLLRWNNA